MTKRDCYTNKRVNTENLEREKHVVSAALITKRMEPIAQFVKQPNLYLRQRQQCGLNGAD